MAKKASSFNWVLLGIAIAVGALSAWMAKSYFEAKEQELIQQLSANSIVMADVIVATEPLQKGDIVAQENMSVRQIRQDTLPLDAIHPSRFAEVEGQMLLNPVAPGRPLLETYLPRMAVSQFSDLLKPGERAVTIDVDDINSTAGMLVPSDHVDLMLLFDEENQDDDRQTLHILLENVTVLATGRRSVDINPELVDTLYDNPANYSTVTLALTVEDSARVSLARDKGKFVTLLRNQKESTPVDFVSLQDNQIFELSEKARVNEVEMIIGGNGIKTLTEETEFPEEIKQLSENLKNTL